MSATELYVRREWNGLLSRPCDLEGVIERRMADEARGYEGQLERLSAEVRALSRALASAVGVMNAEQRLRFAEALDFEPEPK